MSTSNPDNALGKPPGAVNTKGTQQMGGQPKKIVSAADVS